MVIEKSAGRANAIDCLLEIREVPSSLDRCLEGYPEEWQTKIAGKRVVAFYVGADTIHRFQYELQSIYSSIGYVLRVFENSSDTALIWLDNGKIHDILQDVQDENSQNALLEAEKSIHNLFAESHSIIHATGDYIPRIIDIADVYYGEKGKYLEIAKERKLKVIPYDISGQFGSETMLLETWLEHIANPYDFTVRNDDNILEHRRILYYIRPQAIMEHPQLVLKKLERLVAMAAARKSLSFCWAENPKINEILQLLSTEDKEKYIQVRQSFDRVGQIVEIGSSEYRKAIKEVDVYYGDECPLLFEYFRQEMPIIKQCCAPHIRQKITPSLQVDSMGVEMGQGCWMDDYYYFSLNVGNGLCRMKRGSDVVEYITSIPYSASHNRRTDLFSAVVYYEHKLYLIPNGARDIAIFDMYTHTWRTLSLDDAFIVNEDNDYMFSSVTHIGDTLWCIPNSYGAIVKVNLKNERITYFRAWHDELYKYITNPLSTHWSGRAVLVDEKLYFTASQSTHVICFDTKEETSKTYHLDIDAQGLGCIDYDGVDFWTMTIREGKDKLVRWHPDRGVTLVIDDVLGGDSHGGMAIVHSDAVWVFENQNDRYARYDLGTDTFNLRENYLPEKIRDGLGGANLRKDESYIYILPNWGEVMVKLNPCTEDIDAYSPRLNTSGQKDYVKECFKKKFINETEFINDNELALYLENVELKRVDTTSAGKHIYQEVMRTFL